MIAPHYPKALAILIFIAIAIAAALCGGCAPSQPFIPYCLQADPNCPPPPTNPCDDVPWSPAAPLASGGGEDCATPHISGDTFLAQLHQATASHPGANLQQLVAIAAAATLDAPAPTVIEGDPNRVLSALGAVAVLDQLAIADVFPLATPTARTSLQGMPLTPSGYLVVRDTIAATADPELAKLLVISTAENPSLDAAARIAALQQLLITADTSIDFDPYAAVFLPHPSSVLPTEALLSLFAHSDARASRQLTPWAMSQLGARPTHLVDGLLTDPQVAVRLSAAGLCAAGSSSGHDLPEQLAALVGPAARDQLRRAMLLQQGTPEELHLLVPQNPEGLDELVAATRAYYFEQCLTSITAAAAAEMNGSAQQQALLAVMLRNTTVKVLADPQLEADAQWAPPEADAPGGNPQGGDDNGGGDHGGSLQSRITTAALAYAAHLSDPTQAAQWLTMLAPAAAELAAGDALEAWLRAGPMLVTTVLHDPTALPPWLWTTAPLSDEFGEHGQALGAEDVTVRGEALLAIASQNGVLSHPLALSLMQQGDLTTSERDGLLAAKWSQPTFARGQLLLAYAQRGGDPLPWLLSALSVTSPDLQREYDLYAALPAIVAAAPLKGGQLDAVLHVFLEHPSVFDETSALHHTPHPAVAVFSGGQAPHDTMTDIVALIADVSLSEAQRQTLLADLSDDGSAPRLLALPWLRDAGFDAETRVLAAAACASALLQGSLQLEHYAILLDAVPPDAEAPDAKEADAVGEAPQYNFEQARLDAVRDVAFASRGRLPLSLTIATLAPQLPAPQAPPNAVGLLAQLDPAAATTDATTLLHQLHQLALSDDVAAATLASLDAIEALVLGRGDEPHTAIALEHALFAVFLAYGSNFEELSQRFSSRLAFRWALAASYPPDQRLTRLLSATGHAFNTSEDKRLASHRGLGGAALPMPLKAAMAASWAASATAADTPSGFAVLALLDDEACTTFGFNAAWERLDMPRYAPGLAALSGRLPPAQAAQLGWKLLSRGPVAARATNARQQLSNVMANLLARPDLTIAKKQALARGLRWAADPHQAAGALAGEFTVRRDGHAVDEGGAIADGVLQ